MTEKSTFEYRVFLGVEVTGALLATPKIYDTNPDKKPFAKFRLKTSTNGAWFEFRTFETDVIDKLKKFRVGDVLEVEAIPKATPYQNGEKAFMFGVIVKPEHIDFHLVDCQPVNLNVGSTIGTGEGLPQSHPAHYEEDDNIAF